MIRGLKVAYVLLLSGTCRVRYAHNVVAYQPTPPAGGRIRLRLLTDPRPERPLCLPTSQQHQLRYLAVASDRFCRSVP